MILVAVLFVASVQSAHALNTQAKVERPAEANQRIAEIEIVQPEVDVSDKLVVHIEGQIASKSNHTILNMADQSVLFERDLEVRKKKDKVTFGFDIQLSGEKTEFKVGRVNPAGVLQVETLVVVFAEWASYAPKNKGVATPGAASSRQLKRFVFTPSIGITSYSFDQKSQIDSSDPGVAFSSVYLSGRVELRWFVTPRLEFVANAFTNLMSLSVSLPGLSFRLLGLNIRGGYALPFMKPPYKLSIYGGGYYNSLSSSDNTVGYVTLYPQVFLTLIRALGRQNSISAFLKYAEVMGGLSFQGRELAGGLSWTRYLGGSHPLSVSTELADLNYSSVNADQSVSQDTVHSRALSLGVGYGF